MLDSDTCHHESPEEGRKFFAEHSLIFSKLRAFFAYIKVTKCHSSLWGSIEILFYLVEIVRRM
jgi:hypothetical protein